MFKMSVILRRFLSLGGGVRGGVGVGVGGGGMITSFRSRRFMLTCQWCYALDFLRCYVNTSVMWRSWLASLLCSHVSDVTLLIFFGFMFKTSVILRRFLSLRRNTSKKNLKNIQVLAAASLHRQPGLKAILNAMTVYRKDCLAGIVKLSPSDAFKVAKLHWMSWSTGKERCWCVGRWRFATFFHWKFPEIMTNPQF